MTMLKGVADSIRSALDAKGFTTLTPVQLAVLEPERRGADLLVSAQTGAGKTVAFGLAIAQNLLSDQPVVGRAGAPRALVVAPTRELALQVERELTWLFADAGAVVASCVGGMDPRQERRALDRGVHVVVGTPGRLVDHISRGALALEAIEAVVLDEADEMLDLGFRDDLEYILGAAPTDRRTLLFSATVPKPIAQLAQTFQQNAVRVSTLAERAQHNDIRYRVAMVAQPDREAAVVNLLRYHAEKKALVFCATRAMVAQVAEDLGRRGFPVVALSGELSQRDRSQALQAMRDGAARVCVATDVAARGIDLPDLDLVIHAEPPANAETLLHRSGRTGRAGRKGDSVLIATPRAKKSVERALRGARVSADWGAPPSAAEVLARDDARLLADEALVAPVRDTEHEMVARLLAAHGPEQVAAAFLRGRRTALSAPEELRSVDIAAGARSQKTSRVDFEGGDWIALAIGRDQRADVRWLLPMLCNAGGLTKQEIGAIRIHQAETHVQLAPGVGARFMTAIGPSRRLEGGVRVAVLPGPPPQDAAPPAADNRSKGRVGAKRGVRPAVSTDGPPEPRARRAPPSKGARKPAKGSAKTPDKTAPRPKRARS